MRRPALVTVIGLAVLLIASAPPGNRLFARSQHPTATQGLRADWVADLEEWVAAAYEHKPGAADKHAFTIFAWSDEDLRAVITNLQALRTRLARAMGRYPREGSKALAFTYENRALSVFEVRDMLRLTDDEAKRGDVNRLVKRGAMLHADIATLLTEPGSSHGGIIVKDGRYERPGDVVSHWETGRLLLDLIVPSTSGDDLARLWYKATGAYLISTLTFSEAEPHLKRGRALFDPDADLAYLTGLMNEYYASPRLQGFADSLTTPVRSRQYGLEPAHVHLKEAEVLFRRAVELRSDWGEARVRLGRVVGLLGRHEEATAELEVALTCVGDAPELEYFAQLFLGDEQQALGHRQAAVERYTRAAALFPGAQSPYLALAQIARRYGDRTNALRAANQLLMLPGDATQRGDPWWTYLLLPSSDADALLRTLRSRVSHLEAP